MLIAAVGINFDGTINLGQILTIGGGIVTALKMWLSMRDIQRDTSKDVLGLKEVAKSHGDQLADHEHWLVAAGLDRRSTEERRRKSKED